MGNYYSPQSEYYIFTCSLHALALFQFVWVLGMIYRQCNADVCFIDWEPTKIKEGSPSKVLTHSPTHSLTHLLTY